MISCQARSGAVGSVIGIASRRKEKSQFNPTPFEHLASHSWLQEPLQDMLLPLAILGLMKVIGLRILECLVWTVRNSYKGGPAFSYRTRTALMNHFLPRLLGRSWIQLFVSAV